jgi:hypothetical protein
MWKVGRSCCGGNVQGSSLLDVLFAALPNQSIEVAEGFRPCERGGRTPQKGHVGRIGTLRWGEVFGSAEM